MKAFLEILEGALISDLKLFFDLGISHHDEAPMLGVAAARRAGGGLKDFTDEFIGHWIRFQPPHRARRPERIKEPDFPIHLEAPRLTYSVLPTASASGFSVFIRSAKRDGLSCCGPSDSALSGFGCTSISNPSAPAAIAARAIGATIL